MHPVPLRVPADDDHGFRRNVINRSGGIVIAAGAAEFLRRGQAIQRGGAAVAACGRSGYPAHVAAGAADAQGSIATSAH